VRGAGAAPLPEDVEQILVAHTARPQFLAASA
jgi:hypothetical protein